jgi:hypothetical protein
MVALIAYICLSLFCEISQNNFLAIIQTITESNWSQHENYQYHKGRLKLIRCLYLKVRDIYKLLKQRGKTWITPYIDASLNFNI